MALATGALNKEMLPLDVDQAQLMADINIKIYIELLEEYRKIPNTVGRLNDAICGLVSCDRSWKLKLSDDLKEMGFEQSHAGSSVCW